MHSLSHDIIPKPVQMNLAEGFFSFTPSTCIYCVPAVNHEAEMIQFIFKRSAGLDLKIIKLQEDCDANSVKGNTNALILLLEKGQDLAIEISKDPTNEGYSLMITSQSILIQGHSNAGVFYGFQSLRQLLPIEIESAVSPVQNPSEKTIEWNVPCLEIVDYPRFGWRGHMIDEVRHFFGKTFVKRNIDLMALYKLNKLHWHLTDDEGWRIESKKYPKLNEIGSKRLIAKKWKESPNLEDPKWYGGYYTKEELREIILYAAERFIEVIPEIEMPGHATAPLVAYPEFSCSIPPAIVQTVGYRNRQAYCPSKPETYQFLQNVLDEVMEIFPTDKIHLGGDELPKERWENCPVCQQYMKDHNIPDLDEMQVEFAAKNIKYLNSKDKQAIGWFDFSVDKLLQKDISQNGVIFQFWVGSDIKARTFIEKGGCAIISNHRFTYLDSDHRRIPLKKAYSFDPIPSGLSENYHKQVLGIEAPIWTERVWNIPKMDFQVFPRLIAYAENAWTQTSVKDYKDFMKRLKPMLARLDLIGVFYARIFEATNSFLANLIPRRLRRKGYQIF
jgi:hexosaminidase